MDYDREATRRRREYEAALAAQKKLQEKLAALKRDARTAKGKLLSSTTKSETWHRMSLGWVDRAAGYHGEMASARVWLRWLPIHDYVAALAPFAAAMPSATNLEIEVAAVNANLADWTAKGDGLLLDRAKRDYAAEIAGFAAWQQGHPDHDAWRKKAPTRHQGFLIARMMVTLDVEPPTHLNRGEAHDWIASHGGNPRLAAELPPLAPSPSTIGRGGGEASVGRDDEEGSW